jgi:hypothetical protein
MKTNVKRLAIQACYFGIICFMFSFCEKSSEKPSLPSELLGKWSRSFGGSDGCTQSYTFRQYDYTFFESCYYTGSDSYDEDIAEIFDSEKMFRTPDKMYIAWHVDGSKVYLYKTNPGDPKPTLASNWWLNANAWTKN